MKTISTVVILTISGIMTMLIFTGTDPSYLQVNTSNVAGIPNIFSDTQFDLNWSDDNLTGQKLDSCVLADVIIGKNGISECDS